MDEELNLWLVYGGAALGFAFGALLQRSRLCIVAAFSNLVLMRDVRQLHGYLAAVGAAVLGATILESGGWVELNGAPYRLPVLRWGSLVGGGVVFGAGTMLAGGCAARTLVRAAEGNLGSLLALLSFGLVGGATLYGVIAPLRTWTATHAAWQLDAESAGLADILAVPPWLVAGVFVLICLLVIGRMGNRSTGRDLVVYGALVGVLITLGWALTGWWGQDDFSDHNPASITVAGPLAQSLVFVTASTGSGNLFNLFLFAGMFAGALVTALLQRSFRWVPPEEHHVGSYLIGGALMGLGAVFAGGCNIGHGLTGMSTLSLQSLVAICAIIVGMRLGLWWLQRTD